MSTPYTNTSGSASISSTEFSLPASSTSLATLTTVGDVRAVIDVLAMVAGDSYQIRAVDKVNGGTQANVWGPAVISFAQSGFYSVPSFPAREGWDIRMKLLTGSARTIGWRIEQNVGDVNALTLGTGAIVAGSFAASAITSTVIAAAAIGASQIASAAITSAKFATDAIDSNALAASAVTEIQSGLATSTALATVQADTDDIQTRLPAALDGAGNMKAGVQTIVANAITATSIASAAITAAKFATDAIDANALAASAVTEIQSGLATGSAVASIQTDTDDIQTRLPAALDGNGNMKAGVQTIAAAAITAAAIASGAITAAKFAADAIDSGALAASAVTEIQTGLATATALASVQADTTTLTGRLTSTRAGLIDNLDTAVSTRAAAATAVSNLDLTPTRSAKLDNLDAAVTTRAPASTAVSNLDYTAARAAHLDADISTRAAAATALSTATWTNALAALIISALDVAVSTRASASALAAVAAQLPAALDGSGNIKAAVQSLTSGSITSIAAGVMASVIETGFDVTAVMQLMSSALAGVLTGLSTSNPVFKSLTGLKNRITGTTSADGRPTVTYDIS